MYDSHDSVRNQKLTSACVAYETGGPNCGGGGGGGGDAIIPSFRCHIGRARGVENGEMKSDWYGGGGGGGTGPLPPLFSVFSSTLSPLGFLFDIFFFLDSINKKYQQLQLIV